MDIQHRLTSFAILEGSWIMWLLVGFSMGGLAMVIQRAVHLITATRRFRRLKRRMLRGAPAGPDVSGQFPPALCGA